MYFSGIYENNKTCNLHRTFTKTIKSTTKFEPWCIWLNIQIWQRQFRVICRKGFLPCQSHQHLNVNHISKYCQSYLMAQSWSINVSLKNKNILQVRKALKNLQGLPIKCTICDISLWIACCLYKLNPGKTEHVFDFTLLPRELLQSGESN